MLVDCILQITFLHKNCRILIKISQNFFFQGSINNKPAPVHIMAWFLFSAKWLWTNDGFVYWWLYSGLLLYCGPFYHNITYCTPQQQIINQTYMMMSSNGNINIRVTSVETSTSVLLAICAGNSPVPGEFPAQRPVTQSFDVCFDLRLNKRLSKQSWDWWFEMPSHPLWHHSNENLQQTPHTTPSWVSYGGVYYENFEENWPSYNGTATYVTLTGLDELSSNNTCLIKYG